MKQIQERRRPFAQELIEYGPEGTSASVSVPEAEAYCRQLAKGHYENFVLVSWFLPKDLHQHFFHIYAFCRWSDDLGDEVQDPVQSLKLLNWWRQEFLDCFALSQPEAVSQGESAMIRPPRHPVMIALQRTLSEFSLPAEPFLDLISAFEQDQRQPTYVHFEDLLGYCRRSANPVGRIILALARSQSEQNLAWSDSICTGLQLANFWQDVARDFAIGRIYLPEVDRQKFGVTVEDLQRGISTPAFCQLMAFQVERTRWYFNEGAALIESVPAWLQCDLELFVAGGRKILEKIQAQQFRVLEYRPKVTKLDVMGLFLKAGKNHLARKFGFHKRSPKYQGL